MKNKIIIIILVIIIIASFGTATFLIIDGKKDDTKKEEKTEEKTEEKKSNIDFDKLEKTGDYYIIVDGPEIDECEEYYHIYDGDTKENINERFEGKSICYYVQGEKDFYVFLTYYENNSKTVTDIYNLTTDTLVRTVDGAYHPSEEEYTFVSDDGNLLEAWNFELEKNTLYKNSIDNVVNKDGTITVMYNDRVYVLAYNGNVVTKEKKYNRVFDITANYVLAERDGDLVIYDYKGEFVTVIIYIGDKYKSASFTEEDGVFEIHIGKSTYIYDSFEEKLEKAG